MILFHPAFVSGWGDTGVQETSTDKLQESVVPIVESSNCGDGLDEDVIVCAGGVGVGPCKVSRQRQSHLIDIILNLGRQWRATHNNK